LLSASDGQGVALGTLGLRESKRLRPTPRATLGSNGESNASVGSRLPFPSTFHSCIPVSRGRPQPSVQVPRCRPHASSKRPPHTTPPPTLCPGGLAFSRKLAGSWWCRGSDKLVLPRPVPAFSALVNLQSVVCVLVCEEEEEGRAETIAS